MLSKEEIEKAKECLQETIQNTYAEGKAIKLNNVLKYIDQLESDKQKLIEKLEKDTVNITKTMQDGKHCDDYSRCRLKAYRTKTKEILSILKGESQVTVK